MSQVKQVIVMRHDLGMRRGKQIAQGHTLRCPSSAVACKIMAHFR